MQVSLFLDKHRFKFSVAYSLNYNLGRILEHKAARCNHDKIQQPETVNQQNKPITSEVTFCLNWAFHLN